MPRSRIMKAIILLFFLIGCENSKPLSSESDHDSIDKTALCEELVLLMKNLISEVQDGDITGSDDLYHIGKKYGHDLTINSFEAMRVDYKGYKDICELALGYYSSFDASSTCALEKIKEGC